MFVILPWRTDAPVYYWPVVTAALIVINVVATVLVLVSPHPGIHLSFTLILVGVFDMLSFWTLGMVVEGKVGWLKYILLLMTFASLQAFAIGVLGIGKEELLATRYSPILFALLGLAVVWAPRNEIHFFYFYNFLFRFGAGTWEVPILNLVVVFPFIQFLLTLLTGSLWALTIMNLFGFAIGFVIGVMMLKADFVDCENWDLFAVLAGRHGVSPKAGIRIKARRLDGGSDTKTSPRLLKRFRASLAEGNFVAAYEAFLSLEEDDPVSEPELKELIRGLQDGGHPTDSLPVMTDYIRRFPKKAVRMRLKAAEVLLKHAERPKQALRVLEKIKKADLTEQLAKAYEQLQKQAERMLRQGVIEFETEEW